ncbi:mitochondrial import receptor subunit TOM70-like [Bradysia coprophila]|uniref:mitochondrial import receptor subunit TOM70-like n=1 Tax=Bradysia coprophila TaxID=38358 RepID=UPI00187D7015|nr:mitochondrial import receptor subunit TOM70-like [Bradysia coprophila]
MKFQNKQYAAAIRMYDDAIEKFENIERSYNLELAVCYQNRAAARMHLKDPNGSISDADKAIELNEHYSKAYYRRATAYNAERKYFRALQDTVQACILERFQNKTYTDMVCFLLTRIDEHPTEMQWKMAYLEMEAEELSCEHCIQTQLKFIKNIGILDLISVPIPNNETHIGYIKAMAGLKELNIDKIMAGCIEEEAMKGNHLAQSFILRAYMNTVAKTSPSNTKREYPKDLRRMNELILDENTSENIKFNALLCRANMYNRKGDFEEASAELKPLEKKYKNNPLVYIIKSGALLQLSQSNPKFLKELNNCCTLLPNVYELHLQLTLAEISNPLNKLFRCHKPNCKNGTVNEPFSE